MDQLNLHTRFPLIIEACLAMLLFCNCHGQTNPLDICKLNLKGGKKDLNNYYIIHEDSLLKNSVEKLEISIKCPETRLQSIYVKISALSLLKDYETVYKFINALDSSYFNKSYKKMMYGNYFLALRLKMYGDTLKGNKLLDEAIRAIDTYIANTAIRNGKLDQEAYYDLIFLEKDRLSFEEIASQIASLKNKYPQEKAFFEDLEETLRDGPRTAEPIH